MQKQDRSYISFAVRRISQEIHLSKRNQYIDSGATSDRRNDKSILEQIGKPTLSSTVSVGNCNQVKVEDVGMMKATVAC